MSAANFMTTVGAPAAGAVLANLLFLGPMPAVLKARRENDLGDLNPLVFPWIVANCLGYTTYGFVLGDPFIIAANVLGANLGLFYTFTALKLATPAVASRVEKFASGLFLFSTVLALLALAIPQVEVRNLVVGYTALTISLIMFASPLSTLKTVVSTKDASSIDRGFLFMQLLNCTMWVIYGLVTSDPSIVIGNGCGALFGVVQTILICRFSSSSPSLPVNGPVQVDPSVHEPHTFTKPALTRSLSLDASETSSVSTGSGEEVGSFEEEALEIC